MRITTLLLGATCCVLSASAQEKDWREIIECDAFRGHAGVLVLTAFAEDDAASESLCARVELRLRQSRIAVLKPTGKEYDAAHCPRLYVTVNRLQNAAVASVELTEYAILPRNGHFTEAPLWKRSRIVVNYAAPELQQVAIELVEEFCNQYLKCNPKGSSPIGPRPPRIWMSTDLLALYDTFACVSVLQDGEYTADEAQSLKQRTQFNRHLASRCNRNGTRHACVSCTYKYAHGNTVLDVTVSAEYSPRADLTQTVYMPICSFTAEGIDFDEACKLAARELAHRRKLAIANVTQRERAPTAPSPKSANSNGPPPANRDLSD